MKKILLLFLFYLVLEELTKYFLNINQLVFKSLSNQFTSEQIQSILNIQDKWRWVSYLFLPFFIFIKTLIISSVLFMGVFLGLKEIEFKKTWTIVISAEFVFLLVPILKIAWFYLFQTNYTLEDIQYFYPLSALNIVGYKGLEAWLIYPFQVLNLFELAYWLILAYFIGKITETNMDRGLKIVASSYGSALFLWVVVIMFFTLNYS